MVEKIDEKVPIVNIVDKIDNIFPSFLIVLILFFIILFLTGFWAFSSFFTQHYEVEFLIVNENNLPISNAEINIQLLDEDILIKTDNSGKAKFISSTLDFDYLVVANGYNSFSGLFIGEKNIIVKLSKSNLMGFEGDNLTNKKLSISVVDLDNEIILGADIRISCDSGLSFLENQSSEGFLLKLNNICNKLEIKASAHGFEDNIVIVNPLDERLVITLEKRKSLGKVLFDVYSLDGPQNDVEIIVLGEFGNSKSFFTSQQGSVLMELTEGNYSYSVFLHGELKKGNFDLSSNDSKQVNVFFQSKEKDFEEKKDSLKSISLLVVDDDFPVQNAIVRVFQDGVLFRNLVTNSEGKTNPQIINEELENSNLIALIKSNDYASKIVNIEIKESNEFQKVSLSNEKSKLTVNVVDDRGVAQRSASVEIYSQENNLQLDIVYTNSDGVAQINNLPSGSFLVRVNSSDKKNTKEEVIFIQSSSSSDLNIVLITAESNLVLNFFDETGQRVDVSGIVLFEKDGDVFNEVFESTNGRYSTKRYLVGSKLEVIINNEKYYSKKTIEFEVFRQVHNKEIYLRKIGEVPNQMDLQIFVKKIMENNPKNQSFRQASRILPNREYFIYFEVLNYGDSNNPIIFNLNENDTNFIKEIFSIKESSLINSDFDFSISLNNTNYNYFPVIAKLFIDSNYGDINLKFNALQMDNESLDYSRKIVIGESFCIDNCPVFAFDNYLVKDDLEIPLPNFGIDVFNDVSSKIKTKVQNFSQNDFGQIQLAASINQRYLSSIAFENDSNSITRNINISPLSNSTAQDYLVYPKENRVGIVVVDEILQNNSGASIGNYVGNNNSFRLNLKRRENLVVDFKPDYIYESSTYPFAYIETKHSSGNRVVANWTISKNNLGEEILLKQGRTNEEGISLFYFDATNLEEGDEIIIRAEDLNGAIPAKKKIIVQKNNLFETVSLEPICLNIKVENTEIDFSNNQLFDIGINQTRQIIIENSCSTSKRINLSSDLSLSRINFDVNANSIVEIDVTGTKIDDILGVYPISISVEEDEFFTNKIIDFFVIDNDNCFILEDGLFDFLQENLISSSVTNNCLSGRIDNFHPKLDLSTNSVSINYNKPGNPEKIDFNAYVIGSAIEGHAQGSMMAYAFEFTARGSGGSVNAKPIAGAHASTPYFMDLFYETSARNHYDGSTFPRPAPDSNLRNPDISYYEIISTSEKEDFSYNGKIDFRAASRGVNVTSFPRVAESGDWWRPTPGGSLPEQYELFENALNSIGVNSQDRLGVLEAVLSKELSSSDLRDAGVSLDLLSGVNLPVINWPYRLSRNIINLYHGATDTGDFTLGLTNPRFGTGHFNPGYEENTIALGNSDGSVYMGVNLASSDRWKLDAPLWFGYRDGGDSAYIITDTKRCRGDNCRILESNYLGSGQYNMQAYVKGYDSWFSGGALRRRYTAAIQLQHEVARIVENFAERRGIWNEEISLPAVQGAVQPIGNYVADATPTPKWSNLTTWPDGTSPGSGVLTPTGFWGVVDVHPNGFVPPEHMPGQNYLYYNCFVGECDDEMDWTYDNLESNVRWALRDPSDPLVEYDNTGAIMYYIPHDTIPEGVRLFLYNGVVYAEYIGTPEIDSAVIDFDLSQNNLLGNEYAIITATDWTSQTEVSSQKFRIKLSGPQTSCVLDDNTFGTTGVSAVPRLLFDWDWESISINQCDQSNPFSVYCDATQFNISLMKKLIEIENLFNNDQRHLLPEKTVFYSYLIKDNYSRTFLNDFKNYYTGNILKSSSEFLNKFSKFISQEKLEFEVTDGEMPYGGLYRVEIFISNADESTNSMFFEEAPFTNILVRLTPIRKANNYNPFFETPFNGPLDSSNRDYGVGLSNSLALNSSTSIGVSSSSFKQIDVIKTSSLEDLQTSKTLIFDSEIERLYILGSQPNLILMNINSQTGRISPSYEITGDNSNTLNSNNWKMIASNLGINNCEDFSGSTNRFFDSRKANNIFSINMNGENNRGGELTLGTTIFSPKNQTNPLKISPKTPEVNFKGNIMSTTNQEVFLDYFIASGKNDFDTIESIFESVKNQEMCISNNNENVLQIWWNPEYLDSLINEIYNGNYICD